MYRYSKILSNARNKNVQDALAEDIGEIDYTALLIDKKNIKAILLVRQEAVLCGVDWFEQCFKMLDPCANITWFYKEGQIMQQNSNVCVIQSQSFSLLSAERTALNFLQTLSATASITKQYVCAIGKNSPNPNGCIVLDTRKTIPGLRLAQKYAVTVGGGFNQRLGLWDGILIKENHIAAVGGISKIMNKVQSLIKEKNIAIQIEVENIDDLEEAIIAGAKNILLDNFTIKKIKEAVRINRGRAILEASGGINLKCMKEIVETGIDRISIGGITKNILAIDFSLEVEKENTK